MDELRHTLGYRYLQETKLQRQTLFGSPRPAVAPTAAFKEYPGRPRVALLPEPGKLSANLWQLLQARRSVRKYGERPLSLGDLANLLWAAQGLTAQAGSYLFRTAPSGGALYPVETYLAVNRVETVAPGLYHYNVRELCLEQLRAGDTGAELARAGLDQHSLARAAVVFIWSAVLRRNICKYGHRGMRYILMDAGHICQNMLLGAEALGLAACPVGAYYDEECNDLLGLDGEEESVLYMATAGHPAGGVQAVAR